MDVALAGSRRPVRRRVQQGDRLRDAVGGVVGQVERGQVRPRCSQMLRIPAWRARRMPASPSPTIHASDRFSPHREIDAIAAYCEPLDRCFLLPAAWLDGRQEVYLRLKPARNGQDVGLNWAHVVDFAAIDWTAVDHVGAIAQLEERGHGMAEVVGSSPTSSTTDPSPCDA